MSLHKYEQYWQPKYSPSGAIRQQLSDVYNAHNNKMCSSRSINITLKIETEIENLLNWQ